MDTLLVKSSDTHLKVHIRLSIWKENKSMIIIIITIIKLTQATNQSKRL